MFLKRHVGNLAEQPDASSSSPKIHRQSILEARETVPGYTAAATKPPRLNALIRCPAGVADESVLTEQTVHDEIAVPGHGLVSGASRHTAQ